MNAGKEENPLRVDLESERVLARRGRKESFLLIALDRPRSYPPFHPQGRDHEDRLSATVSPRDQAIPHTLSFPGFLAS